MSHAFAAARRRQRLGETFGDVHVALAERWGYVRGIRG